MKTNKRIFECIGRVKMIVLLAFLLPAISTRGQSSDTKSAKSSTPKYSNEFMNIGVGARQFGMGFTAVSNVSDVTSGYWNPAGLLGIKDAYEASFMHSSYFGGLANYDYLGFATSVDDSSKIALSVIRFSVDDIPDTRLLVDVNGAINYDKIKFFSSSDYGFLLSYARHLPFFGGVKFGGSLKVIHRIVGKFSKSWGFGLDAGLQKEVNNWKLGLMFRDIFGTFNSWSHNVEEVEQIYALTGNAVPISSTEITVPRVILATSRDFSFGKKFGLLVSADIDVLLDGKRNTLIKSDALSIDPKVGLEFNYSKLAFLRFGVNQFQQIKRFDKSKEWTFQPNFGLGVKLDKITVDYSLTDVGNLAPGLFSHVFSIKVNFTK